MDTLKLLWENSNVIIMVITSVISIASLITAGTKTPKKGTKLYRAYRLIETLALVIHKAKDHGEGHDENDRSPISHNESDT